MFSKLREIIENLRVPADSLHALPSDLERLLPLYADKNLDPVFRSDIHNLLGGTVALSTILAERSYAAPGAISWWTHLLGIISNIIRHIEHRPAIERIGLLFVKTNELHRETYETATEASQALETLRRLGLTQDVLIVPVTLTCGHVVQPTSAPNLHSNSTPDLSIDPDPSGMEAEEAKPQVPSDLELKLKEKMKA